MSSIISSGNQYYLTQYLKTEHYTNKRAVKKRSNQLKKIKGITPTIKQYTKGYGLKIQATTGAYPTKTKVLKAQKEIDQTGWASYHELT